MIGDIFFLNEGKKTIIPEDLIYTDAYANPKRLIPKRTITQSRKYSSNKIGKNFKKGFDQFAASFAF